MGLFTSLFALLLFAPLTPWRREFSFLTPDNAAAFFAVAELFMLALVTPLFLREKDENPEARFPGFFATQVAASLVPFPAMLAAYAFSLETMTQALFMQATAVSVALAAAAAVILLGKRRGIFLLLFASCGFPALTFVLYQMAGLKVEWMFDLSPLASPLRGGFPAGGILWMFLAAASGVAVFLRYRKKSNPRNHDTNS